MSTRVTFEYYHPEYDTTRVDVTLWVTGVALSWWNPGTDDLRSGTNCELIPYEGNPELQNLITPDGIDVEEARLLVQGCGCDVPLCFMDDNNAQVVSTASA